MKIDIKNKKLPWFTLIETLIWVLIFSIIIIAGFTALNSIIIWKVKLIEKTAIQKEAFYFSEKLFEMIKTWGTIDYEEYWNRYSYDTTYGSGHFLNHSWFGNENLWSDIYHCVSANWSRMWNTWCLTTFNISPNGLLIDEDYSWIYQGYGQYEIQFIDYNSDADNDAWNEDNSSESIYNFIWDDDDLYLWKWPEAFPLNIDAWELYLINANWDERTYFRFNFQLDPEAPTGYTCTWSQAIDPSSNGCLWTIEFLKLSWADFWYDHNDITEWGFDNDGKIDTWLIHEDFESNGSYVVASAGDSDAYWQPLFPDTLHVKDVQFFPYPNKNLEYSWRDADPAINISPYVRISMTLSPSWKSRKKIRGKIPEININTTVQLIDTSN